MISFWHGRFHGQNFSSCRSKFPHDSTCKKKLEFIVNQKDEEITRLKAEKDEEITRMKIDKAEKDQEIIRMKIDKEKDLLHLYYSKAKLKICLKFIIFIIYIYLKLYKYKTKKNF